MDEKDFKKMIRQSLGEPPHAPVDEYSRILQRVSKEQKKSVWFQLVPAVSFALAVVLWVHPKETSQKKSEDLFSISSDIQLPTLQ